MTSAYAPSGKVRIERLIPGAIFLFATAGLVAWGLFTLGCMGRYVFMLVPGIAGLFMAGVLHLVIDVTHTRNQLVAISLAVICTAVLIFGPLLFAYVHSGELKDAFAWLSTRSDSIFEPNETRYPVKYTLFLLTVELNFVGYILTKCVKWSVGRAFCESSNQWMSRSRASLPAGYGEPLSEALRGGEVDLLQQLQPTELSPADERCEVILEYCSGAESREKEVSAYLSLFEYKLVRARRSEGMHPFPVVRQLLLNQDQMAALAGLFPAFRRST
ncbi:MAG: hypothetical protein AAF497_03540 [Planctomycetota bacterium]